MKEKEEELLKDQMLKLKGVKKEKRKQKRYKVNYKIWRHLKKEENKKLMH